MRVCVCGGRNFTDRDYVYRMLDMCDHDATITVIIHGGYRGVDRISEGWDAARIPRAVHPRVKIVVYKAEWDKYPHGAAGPIRNREMIRDGKPDLVLAFAGDDGTDDLCRQAKKAGIEVRRFWPPDRTQQMPLML